MNIDSELAWFFHGLWLKSSGVPPKFAFSVPDTVFYHYGKPDCWYFTNRDGFILKKNRENLNTKEIHQKFISKSNPQSDLVAATGI